MLSTIESKIKKGTLYTVFLKVFSISINIALGVVLARQLGVKELGEYSYYLAIITALSVPTQLGLPVLVVRETALAVKEDKLGIAKKLWRWSTMFVVKITVLVYTVIFFMIYIKGDELLHEKKEIFFYGLLLIPLISLGNLRGAALRGLKKIILGQMPDLILRPLLIICTLIGINYYTGQQATASSAMLVNVSSAALSFLVGAFILWYVIPKSAPACIVSPGQVSLWSSSLIRLSAVAGVAALAAQMNTIMLGAMRGNTDVALYRVALSTAAFIAFGENVVAMVFAPHFAGLYAKKQYAELQRLLYAGARLGVFIALPMLILLITMGDHLLGVLFGDDFREAYLPMVVLCVGQLLSVASGTVGALMNMTGNERHMLTATSISAILNFLLNVLLIPKYGAMGVAISFAISQAVWNAILLRYARKNIGVSCGLIGAILYKNPRQNN